MKKAILIFSVLFAINCQAQQKVTDTLLIKIDTATYKYVVALIKENIDSRSMTGQTIVGNILNPLSHFTFLQPADKPKEVPTKPKN